MSSSNGVVVPGALLNEIEVLTKATRRRFSAEDKRKILRAAEVCTQPGEIGSLLRREGVYFSNLRSWRAQREAGKLGGLAPKQRGPAPKAKHPLAAKVAARERDMTRYKARAEALVARPKQGAARLGIACPRNGGKP